MVKIRIHKVSWDWIAGALICWFFSLCCFAQLINAEITIWSFGTLVLGMGLVFGGLFAMIGSVNEYEVKAKEIK